MDETARHVRSECQRKRDRDGLLICGFRVQVPAGSPTFDGRTVAACRSRQRTTPFDRSLPVSTRASRGSARRWGSPVVAALQAVQGPVRGPRRRGPEALRLRAVPGQPRDLPELHQRVPQERCHRSGDPDHAPVRRHPRLDGHRRGLRPTDFHDFLARFYRIGSEVDPRPRRPGRQARRRRGDRAVLRRRQRPRARRGGGRRRRSSSSRGRAGRRHAAGADPDRRRPSTPGIAYVGPTGPVGAGRRLHGPG